MVVVRYDLRILGFGYNCLGDFKVSVRGLELLMFL